MPAHLSAAPTSGERRHVTAESTSRRASRRALASLMLAAGTLHFLRPSAYDGLIPALLGAPRPWIYASGAAELGVGGLLLCPRTSRVGAGCAAVLLVAVFPGNVTGAVRAGSPGQSRRAALLWARLPLQAPLVWWAWRSSAITSG